MPRENLRLLAEHVEPMWLGWSLSTPWCYLIQPAWVFQSVALQNSTVSLPLTSAKNSWTFYNLLVSCEPRQLCSTKVMLAKKEPRVNQDLIFQLQYLQIRNQRLLTCTKRHTQSIVQPFPIWEDSCKCHWVVLPSYCNVFSSNKVLE